jgi:hypothetical protein
VVIIVPSATGSGNYYDECVPAGTYRYGLQTAFSCDNAGCSSSLPLFTEVTVTTTLPATCTRDATSFAPVATNAVPPWDSNGTITASESCPNHGGCSYRAHTHAGVRAMMLAMLGAGLVLLGRRVRRAKAR